ncbi:MAG TPA: methionyl-tRNA formyltransferase [Pseudomonadales bacterium]
MAELNIVFAGTPAFAARHLAALLDAGIAIRAVYSQPDRAAGRGKQLQASPVKQLALQHGIAVYQPANFRDPADIAELAALQPDLMIVVAYGLLLPEAVLAIPRLGCINVHASLLPRWRGAAPIERAIEAGDRETGITIMQMDKGLDTGAMLLKQSLPIDAHATGDSLREQLAEAGCKALVSMVQQLACGPASGERQDDALASYAHKLSKAEARLDWQQPADVLARKIRAFNSSNVCYAQHLGERIKIWQAVPQPASGNHPPGSVLAFDRDGLTVACGDGSLRITELQLPNARRMAVADLRNGRPDCFIAGQCLE